MKLAILTSTLIYGSILASCAASATTLVLPEPNVVTAGTYNDFTVYSFGLLKTCAGSADCPATWDKVKSDPGAISADIVILGKNGNNEDNIPTPFPVGSLVDNPFEAVGGSVSHFEMANASEPSPSFSGDQNGSWQISLDLLSNWLKGDLVFIFDNNQQGTNTSQNLFLWGQARITDVSGAQVGGNCWQVGPESVSTGCSTSKPVPADYLTKYAAVPGAFCVAAVDHGLYTKGQAYNFGVPSNANDCGTDYFVNNNISTSEAEFAAYNLALDAFIKDTANKNKDYFLTIDFQYANNNGGDEQLFICNDCTISEEQHVPEPATLGLLGLGMLGMAAVTRRRRINK